MALRALMLRKRLDEAKKSLEALRASDNFEKREAELEQAINEAETDEEKQAVEEEVEKFEAEKKEFEEKESNLDEEVRKLESDLAEVEKAQEVVAPAPEVVEQRKEIHKMETRKFFGMNTQERDAFFANDEVKEFLQRMRSAQVEKRSVSGADETIPTVILDLIRENIMEFSKLVNRVRYRNVSGKARQVVMGAIPEAVWTEACGILNE